MRREGFSAAVINPRFAKPVDRDCVAEFGGRCGLVVTLEDHVLAGGFGSAVMEVLNDLELQVPVVRVGWPDAFIEHGKVESLREKYGLTAEAALEKARPYLREDDGSCTGEALARRRSWLNPAFEIGAGRHACCPGMAE